MLKARRQSLASRLEQRFGHQQLGRKIRGFEFFRRSSVPVVEILINAQRGRVFAEVQLEMPKLVSRNEAFLSRLRDVSTHEDHAAIRAADQPPFCADQGPLADKCPANPAMSSIEISSGDRMRSS
jgi:hypothetical protein